MKKEPRLKPPQSCVTSMLIESGSPSPTGRLREVVEVGEVGRVRDIERVPFVDVTVDVGGEVGEDVVLQ